MVIVLLKHLIACSKKSHFTDLYLTRALHESLLNYQFLQPTVNRLGFDDDVVPVEHYQPPRSMIGGNQNLVHGSWCVMAVV